MPIELQSTSPYVERLLTAGRDYLSQQPAVDGPLFGVRVGWSRDYDDLLRGIFSEATAIDDCFDRALSVGRVMLVGQGGSGKSVALRRVMERALDARVVAIFIDLRQWSATDYDEWKHAGQRGLFDQMSFLFERFGQPKVTPTAVETLSVGVPKLVIIDGVNEIRGGVGDELIRVADDYARNALQTSIIVADRLTRRDLRDTSRWIFGRVQPLSPSQIEEHVREAHRQQAFEALSVPSKTLLQSAYFLDSFLREPTQIGSSSERIADYLAKHAGVTTGELNQLASAAFDFYNEKGSRSFALGDLDARIGSESVEKFVRAGVLRLDGHFAYFAHHLLHDYLAARQVAANRPLWNATVFQRITLGGSSFDTLVFVLEQIASPADSDALVRLVYDWNPYGAAYAIGEGRSRGSIAVTKPMEFVMLAMLANRRFDLQKNTATRAADALAISPSVAAREFSSAPDREAVITLVASAPYVEPWFAEWRGVFTIPVGAPAPDQLVRRILDPDSVIGWTAANVLKRLNVNDVRQASLRNEATNESPTVRWRVAHTIGAFPSPANAAILFTLLRDADEWVRFGATRSLVEVAARSSPPQGLEIMKRMANEALKTLDERCKKELLSAVFLSDRVAPEGWVESVALVLRAVLAATATLQEREAGEEVALRFRLWHQEKSR